MNTSNNSQDSENNSSNKKRVIGLSAYIAYHSGIISLLFTVILVGLGERIGERFLPVYIISIGASLFAPSIINSLDNFLSAIYSFPGGWISSKIGYKKALLYFNIFALLGYLIVIIFPGWIAVIIGSVFFLSWSSLSMPACMDLIQNELPKNRQVLGVSLHSLIKRIPMALGPILGGILIDRFGIVFGIRIAFIIAIIFGVIAIVIQQISLKNTVKVTSKKTEFPRILPWQFPKQLQILLGADILAKFSSQIPYAYIAIWAMEYAKGAQINATQFGLLTTIEMLVAIFIYIPVGFLGDRFKKKGFILCTLILYMIFPLVLLVSHSFFMLSIAFIIRGLKEFGEPTRKAQIMELSPEGEKSLYFGAFYLYRDIFVTFSVLFGGYLWLINPELNLLISCFFGLSAVILYSVFGR